MPLPSPEQIKDPSTSNSQMKDYLGDLVDGVQSKSGISNQIRDSGNLFDIAEIKNGMHVNVNSNGVFYDSGTDAAVIRISPGVDYRLYATNYPLSAFGLWLSKSDSPSGVLQKIQYVVGSDGYLNFSIHGSVDDDYYLVLNIRVASQNYDERGTIILYENREFNTNITGFYQKNLRDHLLVNDFDKALGIERTALNLVDNAIHLPGRYINASDNQILNEKTTYSIALQLKAGDYYLYAPNRNVNHILGFSDNLLLGDNVERVEVALTDTDEIFKFSLSTDGYLMMNTRILGSDILSSLKISSSKDIKNPAITKIGNTPIQSTVFHDSNIIGQGINTISLLSTYINARDYIVNTFNGTKSRITKVLPGRIYFVYSPNWNPWIVVYGFVGSISPTNGTTAEQIELQETEYEGVKSFSVPNDGIDRYFMINTIIQNDDIDSDLKIYVDEYVKNKAYSSINGIGFADTELREDIKNGALRSSGLDGKVWVAIGDSITEHNFRSNKNYHDYVAESCKNLVVHNYGQSGTGFYGRSGVANTITQSPDIITVFFGTNDWSHGQKPLGAFLDSTDATISGCINLTIQGLMNKFPVALLALLTPLPRLDAWGLNSNNKPMGFSLLELSEMIIQYAKHYSIPVMDFYKESNLPVWIPEANNYYFTAPGLAEPDGLHPNDEGQKLIGRKIKAFLESI